MKQRHARIRVEGDVQGVSFRAETRREALRLGLAGWVHNEPDGSVTIEAEGAETAVEQLAEWCRSGPELANVSAVNVTEGQWQSLSGFVIQR